MCSCYVGVCQGLLVYSVCRCEQLTSGVFLVRIYTVTLKFSSHLHRSSIHRPPPPSLSATLLNKMLGEL